MRKFVVGTLSVGGLVASVAQASGDISLILSGGQVVTTKVGEDGAPLGPSRVFSGFFELNSGTWYGDEPGLQVEDGTLSAGNNLRLYFSNALRKWDGSSFASLTASQVSAQFGPTINTIITPTTDTNSPDLLFPVEPLGGLHDHPDWVLENFVPGVGPEFFLVQARLSYDGYADSDTFYIVFGVNATEEELEAMELYVEQNIVPAPGSVLALAGMAVLGLRRRR